MLNLTSLAAFLPLLQPGRVAIRSAEEEALHKGAHAYGITIVEYSTTVV